MRSLACESFTVTAHMGSLSPALLSALDEQAHRASRSSDPAQVIRTVGHVLEALNDELRRFGQIRLAAVAVMRAGGSSYDHIAARTGLSKSRVAQLCATAPSAPKRH